MEMMHLFMCDLLGWGHPAQIIFETKTSEEFRHSMVVTNTAKVFAWALIIVMNLFFVYFSVLRGATREFAWQRNYCIACAIQLLVEIVLYESSEALWIHYTIPRLVHEDVSKIIRRLYHTIDVAFVTSPSSKGSGSLDASSFFFVSTKIAEKFPHLFESAIILSYHSTWPPYGSLSGVKWRHDDATNTSSTSSQVSRHSWGYQCMSFFRRVSLFAGLIWILQRIGTMHIRVQKVIIHTIQPLLLSFLIVTATYVTRHPLIAAAILVVIGLEIGVYTALPRLKCLKRASAADAGENDEEHDHRAHEGGKATSPSGTITATSSVPMATRDSASSSEKGGGVVLKTDDLDKHNTREIRSDCETVEKTFTSSECKVDKVTGTCPAGVPTECAEMPYPSLSSTANYKDPVDNGTGVMTYRDAKKRRASVEERILDCALSSDSDEEVYKNGRVNVDITSSDESDPAADNMVFEDAYRIVSTSSGGESDSDNSAMNRVRGKGPSQALRHDTMSGECSSSDTEAAVVRQPTRTRQL